MFAFIGLSKECVLELREKDGVYMTGNGRINISGLCDKNIDYVVESIKKRI
jgi:aspartate aminotransferase